MSALWRIQELPLHVTVHLPEIEHTHYKAVIINAPFILKVNTSYQFASCASRLARAYILYLNVPQVKHPVTMMMMIMMICRSLSLSERVGLAGLHQPSELS